MSFTPKSYSKPQTVTTSSIRSTKTVDDGKKKSLLKDNSWIKTNVNEEEQVERDANFGKSVLGSHKSNENLVNPQDKTSKTESKTSTVTTSSGASVQALTKRFGGSQDKLNETRTTGTKTTVKTEPRKSSTSTTTIKDGTKITETTVTTTKQDVVKSETLTDIDLADLKTKSSGGYKTEVITVRSSKDTVDGPTSPVKTTTSIKTYTKEDVSPTKTTSYSVRSTKSTEDQLFDTLIPTSIKSANTKPDCSDYKTEVVTVKTSKDISDIPTSPVKTTTSIKTYTKEDVSPPKTTSYSTKSDYKTEVVTVKSSKDISDVPTSPVKTTTSIKTYTKEDVSPTKTTSYSVRSTKSTEDQLFDTLIPASIKSANTKPDSSREDVSVSKSIRTVYSTNERDEWSTVTSPSYTRTSYRESRPADYLSDSLTSKTTTTVYTSPERVVSGKDICTVCHKNMYTDEKIVLDDMNINCHASCFKCGVCNVSLGHLKAGDSLWVYRRAIHCESCFGVTKGKWLR
ncbi:mucin-22-like isoform X2 [Sinocyclocheilus rhinocerous]|uniref:mucin-22-like isoform X2 n=1 Tax=Sinocyclocheilus rhinocerous TaxID=307959 RepID=UPI0007B97E0E|nr:PREDICTED: mucin-22-like isoform X2 [Sinocyclocheilus rhinocerous]